MVNVVAQSEVSFLRTTELEFIHTLKGKNKENSKLIEEIKLPCKYRFKSPAFLFIQGFKEHILTLDKQCKRVTSTLVTERNR